ncbi:protein FAM92A isoform X1 [Leopardus geoffroyi]|uniref:CBY1-interacting BAR domain-containing protein 1 isoform X1 n=1 Tax=Herpailurus yagouaroundi TaxID=1608482 RepID=UPI000F428912|nr:protein FAM92A isoform X1 [Puma yagouaroundi]XP_043457306.1 protein FAM92A isoform X1 [Prionailurus bengalensis]XP_044905847.1 protein FAM92A isoform X1 [Felis catus]XP_045310194.1 protein FAM92A isoform X1 [Leopardus geoffroyi]
MLRRSLENRDAQTRQLQDAVTNVEKHFGELCQIFAAYVRKTARLRDKADLLVNEINVYASTETPNLKQGLKNFAEEFAKLQDYRQAEVLMNHEQKVERLEAKVVEPLKAYGTIVKMKRDDLKATLTARNREAKQLTQLERTRQRNPSDRHVISQAETELQRATMDATRTTRHLEETIDNFEKQKIKDIKTIFSEFITIEMLFHGKALEVYTAAYQNIQKIDEEEDLEVFRNSLYPPDYSSRLDIVRANSKSPLQRSLSAKCVSGTGQVSTCRLRKDQQADDDEEDEDLDVTEEEN